MKVKNESKALEQKSTSTTIDGDNKRLMVDG